MHHIGGGGGGAGDRKKRGWEAREEGAGSGIPKVQKAAGQLHLNRFFFLESEKESVVFSFNKKV